MESEIIREIRKKFEKVLRENSGITDKIKAIDGLIQETNSSNLSYENKKDIVKSLAETEVDLITIADLGAKKDIY